MSAHTKAPWKLWTSAFGEFEVKSPDDSFMIASRGQAGRFADESIANARLIAAAPELLTLLKDVAAFMDCIEWTGDSIKHDAANLLHAIEEAIRKTEGQ